jgi:hypothetical protein
METALGDVEVLGARRTRLLAELAAVEDRLHGHMREMRADGATLQEILTASGYRSIDGVRKILDPDVKRAAADGRSRNRRLRNSSDVAKLV